MPLEPFSSVVGEAAAKNRLEIVVNWIDALFAPQ